MTQKCTVWCVRVRVREHVTLGQRFNAIRNLNNSNALGFRWCSRCSVNSALQRSKFNKTIVGGFGTRDFSRSLLVWCLPSLLLLDSTAWFQFDPNEFQWFLDHLPKKMTKNLKNCCSSENEWNKTNKIPELVQKRSLWEDFWSFY